MDEIIFGVELNNTEISQKYLLDTQQRLTNDNFVENPFKGKMKIYWEKEEKIWSVFALKPIYPNFAIIGLFVILGSFVIGGLTLNWGVYTGFAISFLFTFLWSKFFFAFMIRLGLLKAGYKGSYKLLRNKELILRLMKNAD